MNKWLKGLGVGIVAVVLTTLGISASDSLSGISGSLLSMALKSERVVGCGMDSVELFIGERSLCVDRFEVSAGTSCPHKEPKTLQESEKNLLTASCASVSESGMVPWRFVSLNQAQRACASAGKRLLTHAEWYRAALGTVPETMDCLLQNADSQSPRHTSETTCKSAVGAYDMVGNVWEWVDGSAVDGSYNERNLPDTGYIESVDADGVALTTRADTPDELYGEDYFWQSKEGTKGFIRGGFYGSEKDGGLYALNASVDLSFGSAGVGFRCVREYPH